MPDGADEASNKVVLTWGDDMRKMGEGYLWHDEIANKLGGLDVDAAVRISGARFSVLKGQIARLERALIQYFLDFHVSRGYNEVSVPYIVSRSTLEGTGQLPKFEDDLFKVSHQVSGEDAFLIPTAEVPVTNLYRDQILDASEMPVLHVSCTPSFRAEAGSYGRDTRGLLRQHQFHKVELVKIVSAESSTMEHEKMANDAEEVLKSLGLPYRKVLLCRYIIHHVFYFILYILHEVLFYLLFYVLNLILYLTLCFTSNVILYLILNIILLFYLYFNLHLTLYVFYFIFSIVYLHSYLS